MDFVDDQYSEYLDMLNEHAVEEGTSSYEYAASPMGRQHLLADPDEFLGVED